MTAPSAAVGRRAPDVRTTGAAGVATLLGACALRPVFSSGAWFPPVLAAVVVVAGTGLVLRAAGPAVLARLEARAGLARGVASAGYVLVPLAQLIALLCLLTACFAPGKALIGFLPTPGSLGRLGVVFSDGGAELREQATPALTLSGLLALTTLFVGLIAAVVDLLAVVARQAALAGLGLLVLYCVPVSTIKGSVGLTALIAPAAGLALLLWADQSRRLSDDAAASGARPSAAGGVAARIAASALVVGVVLGAVLPTLSEGSLTTGLGGGGGGSSTGTALDPVAELHGDLTLARPIDLLKVRADVDNPGYLRAVSLDRYDTAHGWTLSNLDGELSVADNPRLEPLPAGEANRAVRATIDVVGHDDRFLPLPTSPLAVVMQDSSSDAWRFDRATGTVFGRGVSTAGLHYEAIARQPQPTVQQLSDSPALAASDPLQQRFTALPQLPVQVTDLVTQLTRNATTPYARVLAIHHFLTDPTNGFLYSLSTPPGTSGNDLVDFLRLRRGYCEQYAGAMAVMVRAAGIPARVALGYTPGKTQPNGTRVITSDDAHAWVEAYFQGLGWVPFDPTPIAADRAVAMPWAPRADTPTPAAGGADVGVPTTAPQAGPTARGDRAGAGAPVVAATKQQPTGIGPELAWLAGVLVLAVLMVTPAGIRALQRRRRLASGNPGRLWDELTATATDLGLRADPAWTPRRTADRLTAAMGSAGTGTAGTGAVAEAVLRLAHGEEAASYGPPRPSAVDAEMRSAVRTARRGLMRASSRRTRMRARLWPTSLVTGAWTRLVAPVRRMGGALRVTGRPVRRRTV